MIKIYPKQQDLFYKSGYNNFKLEKPFEAREDFEHARKYAIEDNDYHMITICDFYICECNNLINNGCDGLEKKVME